MEKSVKRSRDKAHGGTIQSVHWRTHLWMFLKTGKWLIVVAVPSVIGIYVLLPKIFETNEWALDKLLGCSKVKQFLAESLSPIYETMHGPKRYPIVMPVHEIAVAVRMSEKRVLKCLQRLKSKSEVEQDKEGWKIVKPL